MVDSHLARQCIQSWHCRNACIFIDGKASKAYNEGMNEREYNRLKQQLEAEYKRKLEALETVWQFARESTRETAPAKRDSAGRAGTLMGAIRSVLPYVEGEFDINTIIKLVEERNKDIRKPINPTSVSGSLRKLEKANAIMLTEVGAGKRPNRYRKVDRSIEAHEEADSLIMPETIPA